MKLVRDNEVLWVAYFLSRWKPDTPCSAGNHQLRATSHHPFISTTYPEINRAITQKLGARKELLRKITLISGSWTLVSRWTGNLWKMAAFVIRRSFVPANSTMMTFC